MLRRNILKVSQHAVFINKPAGLPVQVRNSYRIVPTTGQVQARRSHAGTIYRAALCLPHDLMHSADHVLVCRVLGRL